MVLFGLSSATYVGWVSGVLLLQSPTGPPTVPRTRSLHTLLLILTYLLMTSLWIDFHIRHWKILENDSAVEKFLSMSLFIGSTFFDLYFRLCFMLRSKLIARFLKTLETDVNKLPPHHYLKPSDRRRWKSYRKLIYFVHIYHTAGAVLTTLWVAIVIRGRETRLLGFINESVYPVIFCLFGAIPLVSSSFVSFAFVVVTTLHVQLIFDDFYLRFLEIVGQHEQEVGNPMKRDLGEVYSTASSKSSNNSEIISKFEHLKLLCNQYDKICGPLLSGLLVRAVFVLISSANTIMLYDAQNGEEGKRMKLIVNIYYFLVEASQLVLLQLGHRTGLKISERKENLHRSVILMNNLTPREQMKEVVGLMSEWDWKVTGGPHFFEVDRPLLSGVVSSLMTYVTILFQMNVNEEDTGGESSNSNVTTLGNHTREAFLIQ